MFKKNSSLRSKYNKKFEYTYIIFNQILYIKISSKLWSVYRMINNDYRVHIIIYLLDNLDWKINPQGIKIV